jgi:hypothetical protein
MKVAYINATPRSKIFKYYTSAGNGGSTSSSATTYSPNYIPPNAEGEVVINTIDSGNVVKSVTVNADDNTAMDVTMGNAVTKIVAGNNITISPSSGIGDVTVTNAMTNVVTKIIAGNNITISPTSGIGNVTITSSSGSSYTFDNTTVINNSNNISGNKVNMLYVSYNYDVGTYTPSVIQSHPVRFTLQINRVAPAGQSYYINLPSAFNLNNSYGFQLTPFVNNTSDADSVGQYLHAVLINNSNLLTVKLINGSTQSMTNLVCFVSFWTTVNYNNLFPN